MAETYYSEFDVRVLGCTVIKLLRGYGSAAAREILCVSATEPVISVHSEE